MSKFVEVQNDPDDKLNGYFMFDCPACGYSHYVNTNPEYGSTVWEFNGDVDKPTVKPSIFVNARSTDPTDIKCHSFITDGKIQYLNDCTHSMAGQTIELPEID